MSERDIESVLHEKRLIKPPSAFRRQALMKSEEEYLKLYRQSIQSPAAFWKKAARDLEWIQPFKSVCEWKAPFAKWFVGGKLNASANCLDRHVNSHRRHKAAIIWEGEPGDRETWTYFQLYQEVCRFANGLQSLGIKKGDRVAIYMPMVPQAVVAMLGCARIGATHSVVFGGFSAESLKERINDCEAKCVITADGGWRRGKILELKSAVDEAVKGCRSVEKVIVVQRTRNKVRMGKKDIWYHDLVAEASPECPPAALDSEHPLFVLYTSGSTGKPKGILHTTAGYLLGCQLSTRYVFDLKEDDLYWCTADIGWITGHSYVVYGVLANGGTSLIYEGAPNYPEPDRFWQLIEEHRVSIFYTAPTAIRAFMKWGDDWVDRHDLSSLRLLGTVGEPINPEAWMWYFEKIGGKRCPIVDTWWQTETGSHMVTTLPGVHSMRPGSAGVPFFGVDLAVVDETGKEVPPNTGGKLIIRRPWPSMLRTIFGDASRYQKQYWSEFKGCYLTGDGARKDKKGYFWIVGRIDDVLNVSGHRLGTAEVESALVSHPKVAEAAVVGRPDEIKGQGIVAFVSLSQGARKTKGLRDELLQHVAKEIGAIARPDSIRFADALPKTRSGKIMRRLLRNIAAGTDITGDTSTLEDPGVIQSLQEEV